MTKGRHENAVILTAQQVAERYPAYSVGTLANLRCMKKGSKYFKIGKRVFYRVEDVEAWLFQNPVLTIDSIDRS